MESEAVIPDVIDKVPINELEVRYDNEANVKMGNVLTRVQAKKSPVHVSWPYEEDALYTLCMVDPDAPSRRRHFLREFQHWLVMNIPKNDISAGDSIYRYIGPGPPIGSGMHRYVFLVYKQPSKLMYNKSFGKSIPMLGRAKFSTKEFAKKYNLGEPIAGNFFQAQFASQRTQ
ncbi:protein D2-like isoform X2 [Leptotrombidium deliense]|uniref:Protein D2-like isoform X2 n=1 Tax=Leptotrombidium deliense TaxID=299467 RepID=A0A443SF28_9ACAR|nr:protein D2-like isoform X2 [Leptotrombidium deliense]